MFSNSAPVEQLGHDEMTPCSTSSRELQTGGGCWEISVLICGALEPPVSRVLLFAKTVESLGPRLVPITAFMVGNVCGDQVRGGHNNL